MTVKLLTGQLEINWKVPTSQGSTHTETDTQLSAAGTACQLFTRFTIMVKMARFMSVEPQLRVACLTPPVGMLVCGGK